MRCCRSDWPGLYLLCCYQPLWHVSATRVDFGLFFFVSQIFQFYPPPPNSIHPFQATAGDINSSMDQAQTAKTFSDLCKRVNGLQVRGGGGGGDRGNINIIGSKLTTFRM